MKKKQLPFEALERIFHEPKRLAIMSTLAASEAPLTFVQLKETCALTDGNLNRHLQVLADEGAIKITKAFVNDKPRTTAAITSKGLTRFSQYLEALHSVLKHAQQGLPAKERKRAATLANKTAATAAHA
jgi:DNA-binding MarR family transcriptional regulator